MACLSLESELKAFTVLSKYESTQPLGSVESFVLVDKRLLTSEREHRHGRDIQN